MAQASDTPLISARRVLVAGLIGAVVAAVAWLAVDRFSHDGSGGVTAAGEFTDPGQQRPTPSVPETEDDSAISDDGGDSVPVAGDFTDSARPQSTPSVPETEDDSAISDDGGDSVPVAGDFTDSARPQSTPSVPETEDDSAISDDGGDSVPVAGDFTDSAQPQSTSSAPETEDDSATSVETVAQTPQQPELGLEEIVREFMLLINGGETFGESNMPDAYAKHQSEDLETRRRGWFELEILGELINRWNKDPYYPWLSLSKQDNWDLCWNEYGLPTVLEWVQLSQEQQDAMLEELGLIGERMLEAEERCWSQSRIYAGKDEETDRLLELQHEYYLKAAQDWVQENPDSVVPLPDGG